MHFNFVDPIIKMLVFWARSTTRAWTFGWMLLLSLIIKNAVKYWCPFSINIHGLSKFPYDLICCGKSMLFKLEYTTLDWVQQVSLRLMYMYLLAIDLTFNHLEIPPFSSWSLSPLIKVQALYVAQLTFVICSLFNKNLLLSILNKS